MTASNQQEILDVRLQDISSKDADSIQKEIFDGLMKPTNQKTMPTLLLYNELGLRLYDDITTKSPEYYPFAAEESILKIYGDEIAHIMHSRSQSSEDEIVVELGAGALRKTSHLLRAFSHLVPEPKATAPITYYALDLEKRELERTLAELSASEVGSHLEGKVATKGMWGTYDGGLKFIEEGGLRRHDSIISPQSEVLSNDLREMSPLSDEFNSGSSTSSASGSDSEVITPASTPDPVPTPPLHIVFLGSSLGNFPRGADANFLGSLPLRSGSADTLLLGLDHNGNEDEIKAAYNDAEGISKKFAMNGLKAAGTALGDETLFSESSWDYFGKYNPQLRRHEACYISKRDQIVHDPYSGADFKFFQGELVNVAVSHKYSDTDARGMFTEANLRPVQRWMDPTSRYSLWLLERPAFA